MRLAAFKFAVLVCPLVFLAGCGGNPKIDGKVTFDGQPVDGGTITFISGSGGANGGGQIKDGKYSFVSALTPGTYKVEINWFKSTGKTVQNKSDSGTTQDETKQVIPMEYNSQSKLTAEVKSGSQTFDFELKAGGAVDQRQAGTPQPKSKAAGDN